VTDGGYVPLNTSIQVDVAASESGYCSHFEWGIFWNNIQRNLNYVVWSQVSPAQSFLSFAASLGFQSIDTTQYPNLAGGSGPQNIAYNWPNGSGVGSYQLQFVTRALATECNIPTDSTPITRTLNVVECKPNWYTDPSNNIEHLVPTAPPNQINVFLDPAIFGADGTTVPAALDAAITSWNNALTASGVSMVRVTSPCPTGPACITVQSTDLGQSICGKSPLAQTDSNGGYTGNNLYLQLNSNASGPWSTWSGASLQRTFAHELGHRLGLKDDSAICDISAVSAVMEPNFSCGIIDYPSTSPTATDTLPINNTVYGGQTRSTCGFPGGL
jgi:hypothetical protein